MIFAAIAKVLGWLSVGQALSKKLAPLAFVLGLILAGWAIYAGINTLLDRLTDTAEETGATHQREADLTATLERTETANAAAEEVRRDPDAAYALCLRHSRTPANCRH